MRQILNTLYVMSQGAYVRLDHETLKVQVEGETKLQVPLHHLGGVVCFGNVMVSPSAMGRCVEEGRAFVFLSSGGRFRARVVGPTSGNVLLRRAQHQALDSQAMTVEIARNIIAGKVRNARQVIMRAAREAEDTDSEEKLREAGTALAQILGELSNSHDLHMLRGHEGQAAANYFGVFGLMVRKNQDFFVFHRRTRRPPRDPINALLSFLYALLLNDCVSAAEGVGLDPQVGYLHGIRPGRPSLGLDLMEELRHVLADRLVLTLINRQQVSEKSFVRRPGGAVHLTDEARREVVVAYQTRKSDEVHHQVVDSKVPFGLVGHIQARLLARHLRGDLEQYIPFIYR